MTATMSAAPIRKNMRKPNKKHDDNRARTEHSGIVSASAIPRRQLRNELTNQRRRLKGLERSDQSEISI